MECSIESKNKRQNVPLEIESWYPFFRNPVKHLWCKYVLKCLVFDVQGAKCNIFFRFLPKVSKTIWNTRITLHYNHFSTDYVVKTHFFNSKSFVLFNQWRRYSYTPIQFFRKNYYDTDCIKTVSLLLITILI